MARVNIEECWWTDPRREMLATLVGGLDLADARMIRAWRLAQEFWKNNQQLVPKELFDVLQGSAEIIRSGLAVVRDCSVYVRGSSTYLDWAREQREKAREAGKKSAEARRNKSGSAQPQKPKNQTKLRTPPERAFEKTSNAPNDAEPSVSVSDSDSDSDSGSGVSSAGVVKRPPTGEVVPLVTSPDRGANREVWESYRGAYQERYRVEPVRNAKVNANIAQFTARVGAIEAPEIAAFFVRHNDSFYVKSMHAFSLCLRDAEALRTQWAKGKAITQADIRRFERNQETASILDAIDREGV